MVLPRPCRQLPARGSALPGSIALSGPFARMVRRTLASVPHPPSRVPRATTAQGARRLQPAAGPAAYARLGRTASRTEFPQKRRFARRAPRGHTALLQRRRPRLARVRAPAHLVNIAVQGQLRHSVLSVRWVTTAVVTVSNLSGAPCRVTAAL